MDAAYNAWKNSVWTNGRTDGRMDELSRGALLGRVEKRKSIHTAARCVYVRVCESVWGGLAQMSLDILRASRDDEPLNWPPPPLSLSVDRSIDPLFDDSSLSRLVVKNTEFSGRGYLYLFFSLRFCFREKWVSVGFFFWRFRLTIVLLY